MRVCAKRACACDTLFILFFFRGCWRTLINPIFCRFFGGLRFGLVTLQDAVTITEHTRLDECIVVHHYHTKNEQLLDAFCHRSDLQRRTLRHYTGKRCRLGSQRVSLTEVSHQRLAFVVGMRVPVAQTDTPSYLFHRHDIEQCKVSAPGTRLVAFRQLLVGQQVLRVELQIDVFLILRHTVIVTPLRGCKECI